MAFSRANNVYEKLHEVNNVHHSLTFKINQNIRITIPDSMAILKQVKYIKIKKTLRYNILQYKYTGVHEYCILEYIELCYHSYVIL